MRRVPFPDLRPGMVVAEPIYGSGGQMVLNTGVEIKDSHLERMAALCLPYVYVTSNDSHLYDAGDEAAKISGDEIAAAAHTVLADISLGQHAVVDETKALTLTLLAQLCRCRSVQPMLATMRGYNDYLFSHSVQVMFFSLLAACRLEFDRFRLQEIAVGALLHDIGMTQVPASMVDKPSRLTDREITLIKRHPLLGFESLRQNPDISLLAANCALQHHERHDGSGYARGLRGKDIHEFPRIVAVSDVFAALTAATPYRPALSVYQAGATVLRTVGQYFDESATYALLEQVISYPLGSIVRLNTQHMGVVAGFLEGHPLKPIVHLRKDGSYSAETNVVEIDVCYRPDIYILDVLSTGKA